MVPTRIVKAFVGALLLPVCWVATKTFCEEFMGVAVRHHFWSTDEFFFFAWGVLAWVFVFFVYPRPLLVYVFGHELTHALWVWLQGGQVSEFKVGREGDTSSRTGVISWCRSPRISFPIYSIAVIAMYAGILWYDPDAWLYRRWLFAAIGFTWGFHVSFTLWMIPKRQTDLLLHGTFFSLVVIYLANLAVLTVLLIVACPQVHWVKFEQHLVHNAIVWCQWVCDETGWEPPRLW